MEKERSGYQRKLVGMRDSLLRCLLLNVVWRIGWLGTRVLWWIVPELSVGKVELIDRGLYSPSERNDQTFALLGNQAKDDQMKVISKDRKRSRNWSHGFFSISCPRKKG